MKKYSLKFWLIFWLISAVFLTGWFCFWQVKNRNFNTFVTFINHLPMSGEKRVEYATSLKLADYLLKKDNKEKTFLLLFQNNLELRPGGGFIGAFGILKIKNGRVQLIETHDLSNFDIEVPENIEPPYPMKEIGYVDHWKLRDSNWSPDFPINALKAESLYHLGGGKERIDGVIGITANVLTSLLAVTGPVEIEGYPGAYDSENAILKLEYQVEKAFDEQGIEREERKSIMGDLARAIMQRAHSLSLQEKKKLVDILLGDLQKKDIQLYFTDSKIQDVIENAKWAGKIDEDWNKDYLMTIDANLGSFKSDYYVRRSLAYTIDLSKDEPLANLKITYVHTAKQMDWMTRGYLTYLRVYVPQGAKFSETKNFDGAVSGEEFGKKYFGALVKVPLDSTKTVEINYTLPQDAANDYGLLIQKQAGLSGVPVSVHVINSDGTRNDFSTIMDSDLKYSEIITK